MKPPVIDSNVSFLLDEPLLSSFEVVSYFDIMAPQKPSISLVDLIYKKIDPSTSDEEVSVTSRKNVSSVSTCLCVDDIFVKVICRYDQIQTSV